MHILIHRSGKDGRIFEAKNLNKGHKVHYGKENRFSRSDRKNDELEQLRSMPVGKILDDGARVGAKDLMLLLTIYSQSSVAKDLIVSLDEVMVPSPSWKGVDNDEDPTSYTAHCDAIMDMYTHMHDAAETLAEDLSDVMIPPPSTASDQKSTFAGIDEDQSPWAYMSL